MLHLVSRRLLARRVPHLSVRKGLTPITYLQMAAFSDEKKKEDGGFFSSLKQAFQDELDKNETLKREMDDLKQVIRMLSCGQ